MNENRALEIEYHPISQLKPSPRNARVHSDIQLQQLAQSIREFGFNVPALVDADGVIIVGHGRVEAARRVGLQRIPVITVAHLTPAQVTAFRIADNKLAENSRWNRKLLREELKYLTKQIDFNIESAGFELAEIDLLVEGVEPVHASTPDPADDAPLPQSGPAVTRMGDIWRLGPHRILCGSAHEESFARLLQGCKAKLVVADPSSKLEIDCHPLGQAESSIDSSEEFIRFLSTACALLAANSVGGSLHYMFIDWHHLREMLAATKSIYNAWEALVVWDKCVSEVGDLYRSQHELILVFGHGNADPVREQLGLFKRTRTDVWSCAPLSARNSQERNPLKLQLTAKPTRLIAEVLLDASAPGDLVLDLFCGGGTTVIAAEKNSRICCGIDLNPHSVDLTVRRWQAFTGLLATHAASRCSFNDVQEGAQRGN